MNSNFGDSIEDYSVLDLVGKGGFACVYRAKSKHNGQEVAIKMIDKKFMQAAGMVARVRNEVEIHSRLKHPAVLELYNYFEDANYVYLVVEMCHNGELNRYLKSTQTRLTETEARRIFRQVVEGLLYLHSHKILHRDLSLSNLMLTKNMDAKIGDFGLAAQLKAADEKHYTMCGTPNYIAPEVASRRPHGLECDVWSLGCMLYTLLVGHPPFDMDGVKNTLNKVVAADFEIPSDLSPQAKDLIACLLKKHPAHRLRLSEILSHPFMSDQHSQPPSQETPLPKSQPLIRGVHPFSQASLDSGQYTMSSSSQSVNKSGPLRATARPHGIENHIPSPLSSITSTSDSTHSRPRSIQSTLSNRPATGHRKTRSVDGSSTSEKSYHLARQTPNSLKNSKYHSRSCENVASGNKENASSQQSRRAKSDFESRKNVSAHQQATQPFKDRTNVLNERPGSDNRKGVDRRTDESERRSGGSLKELVPPLNAARLRPIKQQTRSAIVSITSGNKVCLEFVRRSLGSSSSATSLVSASTTGTAVSARSGEEVTEIVQISSNGMNIEILRPMKSTRSVHNPSSEHEGFYLHAFYSYHDLPQRYWKKYQYASQFVGLVRAKTPKVTLYTELAKCMLMENGGNPDYEACFYDGAKIHQSGDKLRCIEQGGVSYTLDKDTHEVPTGIASYLEHARLTLQKCKDVESAITNLEKQSSNESYFPVTIRRRPQKDSSGSLSMPEVSRISGVGSVSTVCQSSPSVLQQPQHIPQCEMTPTESSFQPPVKSRRSPSSHSSTSTLRAPTGRMRSASKITTTTTEEEPVLLKSVYVEGSGWASQMSTGEVWVQYNDGSQVKVQPSPGAAALTYANPQGQEMRFGKNDKLPEPIKAKFACLPKVIDSFVKQT